MSYVIQVAVQGGSEARRLLAGVLERLEGVLLLEAAVAPRQQALVDLIVSSAVRGVRVAGWELIGRGGAARLDRSVVRAHHELGLHPLAVGLQRHPGPARYNWSNIPKVNAAARRALEDRLQHPSRLLWLPAASISATRIDAHPANAHPATDCLHYCMPGPVDQWVHALFHLLATKPLN